MKAAENQKQSIAVTHFQHEFGVTNEMEHFLTTRTDGEALDTVHPSAVWRSLDDSRQVLSYWRSVA